MKNHSYKSFVAILLLLLWLTGRVTAEPNRESQHSGTESVNLVVAVMPIKDFTNTTGAYTQTVAQIYSSLTQHGVEFVSSEQIRPTLRHYRIRSAGAINEKNAQIVAGKLGVDFLMLGSIDFYRDGINPEFGLSLRLIDRSTMEVVVAASVAASGSDSEGLFGAGRVTSVDTLIVRTVAQAVTELVRNFNSKTTMISEIELTPLVAIVPFETIAKNRFSGQITATWLIAALLKQNFRVIEPGAVLDITESRLGYPVGQIDYRQLLQLNESKSIDLVITGEVDKFRMSRGSSMNSFPEIIFGGRMIDVLSRQILSTYNGERRGAESEIAFRFGQCHTLGELLRMSLDDMIHQFEKKQVSYGIKQ